MSFIYRKEGGRTRCPGVRRQTRRVLRRRFYATDYRDDTNVPSGILSRMPAGLPGYDCPIMDVTGNRSAFRPRFPVLAGTWDKVCAYH